MWLRERMVTGPWLAAGELFGTRWEQLMRLALGPLADDPDATTVMRTVLHPRFYQALAAGARSAEEVADLVASVVTPWFGDRERRAARRA